MKPNTQKPPSSQGEAVERAIKEHLKKKFPGIKERILAPWVREIMTDSKGEMSEELKNEVSAARKAYQDALTNTDETEDEIPDTLRTGEFEIIDGLPIEKPKSA